MDLIWLKCIINGYVDLSGITIDGKLIIRSTNIKGGLLLSEGRIKSRLDLVHTNIGGPVALDLKEWPQWIFVATKTEKNWLKKLVPKGTKIEIWEEVFK
jgi:hypothetical protein